MLELGSVIPISDTLCIFVFCYMLVSIYLYALPSKISSLVCYEKLWLKEQQLILDEVFLYSWLAEHMTQVHKQAKKKSQKFPDEHMCAGVCVEVSTGYHSYHPLPSLQSSFQYPFIIIKYISYL